MTETPEDQVFADAIEVANIPTLLMVLVQLDILLLDFQSD